jgi:antirestriction protein ArdC
VVGDFRIPFNETTGDEYRGGNIALLLGVALERGYDLSHGWAGFHQWIAAGRQVMKGQNAANGRGGTGIRTMGAKTVANGDGTTTTTTFPGKMRTVFHFDQTEKSAS